MDKGYTGLRMKTFQNTMMGLYLVFAVLHQPANVIIDVARLHMWAK